MHWSQVAGIKKTWKTKVIQECYGKLPLKPLIKAHAIFTRHSSSEPDSDNLASSFKSIRDGLVSAGVLIDDNPNVLKADYCWKKTSPKNGYVSIDVVEIE